jgi:peroxiredoxin
MSMLSRRSLLALLAAAGPANWVSRAGADAPPIGTAPGQQFPDIVYRTEAGQTKTISQEQGKVRLVYLWAVWCPICYNDIVSIQGIYDTLKSRSRFSAIVLNLMDDYRAGVAWARQRGLTLPLNDSGMSSRSSHTASTTQGPYSLPRFTPQFYVVAANGVVVSAIANAPGGTVQNLNVLQAQLTAAT